MRVIHKYPVPIALEPLVTMPRGAKVLSFGAQNEQLFIWALVETEEPLKTLRFYLAITGEQLKQGVFPGNFIGTAMLSSGSFVAHLFEA